MSTKLQPIPTANEDTASSPHQGPVISPGLGVKEACGRGLLIVNADDWGRSREATDRTLDCVRRGTVSSVSAMVFINDSERAAALALEYGVDAGLHLNFTSPFSGSTGRSQLALHQARIRKYLRRYRFSQVIFHPGLTASFEYVVAAQLEEFTRLYGHEPSRVDGHHHMHLCANVLWGGLLPKGTIVRRSFSFRAGEKSIINRCYRHLVDSTLGRHHQLTDFFFSIEPIAERDRLERIVTLSRNSVVELETHPEDLSEYAFLMGGRFRDALEHCAIANHFGPIASAAVLH